MKKINKLFIEPLEEERIKNIQRIGELVVDSEGLYNFL